LAREARREAILTHLRNKETATVEELAELVGVSKMTVHRDLDRLAELRMVRKIRGGATLLPSLVFESDHAHRLLRNTREKQALAQRMAQLIEPGMALFIDDSTTAGALLPHLVTKQPLTVITNARRLVNALIDEEEITVICLGGQYDAIADAFVDYICEVAITHLRADVGIFSTAAVQGTSTYLHYPGLVRIKLAMMASSDRTVMAFDHHKFGKSALNLFNSLTDFDHVFLTEGGDPERLEPLRSASVPFEVVPVESLGSAPYLEAS
jgi:DeoR/GlpR family transcriptional regulator of sugar metabolism